LVKTCFLTSVLTWKRLSFTFQTHNSNLLDPHFSPIFNIQKCNIFVVFSNSPDASEKVDLMLFLWTARLVKIYSLTSFMKKYHFWHFSMFHTLQEQPSELHNLQHFLHHQINSFLTSFHFCELPAWCKSTHLPLLTKLGDFESSWALKAWKSKLCSFCEIPAWWKSTHLPILTKLEAFESSKA